MHFGAWGQSKIYQVAQTSDTSIVRHWNGKMSVAYSVEPSGDKCFLLVEAGMQTIRKMDVPTYVTVNDFRIFHDTLFLGGHVSISPTATHGLLACFPMADFASGTGDCHWVENIPTAMPDCYGGRFSDLIHDISRLAIYDNENHAQIAFIAKNHIVGESIIRVGIGWAQFDGNAWDEELIYNKEAKEAYTDIVTTDNYVVAVGRTNDSSRFTMRIFPKTDFITVSSFYSVTPSPYYGGEYTDHYGQGLADQIVVSDVMATAMNDDKFAVAYHYKDDSQNGLALKTFTINLSRATLQQSMNVPNEHSATPNWTMRDVRYDHSSHQILVLNDIDAAQSGSLESIIHHFKTSELPAGIFTGQYVSGYRLYAMDTFLQTYCDYTTSGKNISSDMHNIYYETIGNNNSCGQEDIVSGMPKNATLYLNYMTTNTNDPDTRSFGTMHFTTYDLRSTIICNH